MKQISLPAHHYASSWKTEGVILRLEELDELGLRFADTRDPNLQLEIVKCFHPHLMKYVVMICRGHLPILGVGRNPGKINPDVEQFLRYFLPKGQRFCHETAIKVLRHLHLAFKGMQTEEVYDILMGLLVSAINKYDPHYTKKVRQVTEVIDHELSRQRKFTLSDVNRHLDLDGNRYLRVVCRPGFLTPL